MEHKIKKLEKSKVEIEITVSEEKMKTFREKACEDLSHEVKISGFRPGHVPAEVLEQHLDKKYILAHTQEIAIQKSYADVVIKEKIQVVSRPKIKIEKDTPFTFTATVAVMPEVELKDYKSIKVEKKEIKVTEKDIEEVIKDLKKYSTVYKDVEREAKKGDRVEIDFEGFDEKDAPIDKTKSKNHPVIIGDETLIPGFEDNLVGMKKGDKKEFDLTFPKDYGKKDFQNKKVKFKVELNRIEEPVVQEVNEDFVEKITGKKQSVEEFKKEIETNVKARKEQESKQERENKYLEELLKKAKIELPEALIEEEAEYIIEDVKDDITQKGLEFTKFLEQAKVTEDDLRKKYRPEAEKRLKIRLSLQYMIKEEKIEVKQEEIKAEYEKMKSYYPPKEQAKVDKEFEDGHLKSQIINKLALRKLFEIVLP